MKTDVSKMMNAANWIAASRLFVIPVIVVTTVMGLHMVTGIIIFLALSTDMLDGFVARKFGLESKFGAKLDSIADASLLLTASFSIVWFYPAFIKEHWWQVSLLMSLYLFQFIYSLIRFGKLTSYHTYAAKVSCIAAGILIAVFFFYRPVEWVFYIVWIIGLIEQIDEISLMFVLPTLRENVKGIYWVLRQKRQGPYNARK